jgi:tetratricopeptide (TPR) repeat protein
VNSYSIPVEKRTREDLVRAVDRIIDLVSSSQYTKAVNEGNKIRDALTRITVPNNLDSVLLKTGFEVWYAHALMYTGRMESATQLLNGLIGNLEKWLSSDATIESNSRFMGILGRAHNHLGYINWMNLGHYEMALSEFWKAARVLLMGGKSLQRELATAYDNMGRVYAQLGFRSRAMVLIEQGKQLREQSNDWDRLGLSLTSNAIANLEFGQPYRALQSSEKAYLNFSQKSSEIGQRGIGLALLTKAQSLRNISLQTYEFNQITLAMKQIEMALKILKRAEKAFLNVGEEVRLFQVYNEIGCAHRERALLLKQIGATDKAFGAIDLAVQFLEESIKIAKGSQQGYKYPAYFVDACEDIAQVYFINGNTKKTSEWLERGVGAIPHNYKFNNMTPLMNITAQECYEEFWQQLGKIHLLRSQMMSDTLSSLRSKKKSLSLTLQKSIEDLIIATAYFGRFTQRPLNVNNASLYPQYKPELRLQLKLTSTAHKLLSSLEAEELQRVKKQIYPQLCGSYSFKPVWLELFDDGLDFLLTINEEYM